jgi:hypothetical protein
MLCWDIMYGWRHWKETRELARKGREAYGIARAERLIKEEEEAKRGGEAERASLEAEIDLEKSILQYHGLKSLVSFAVEKYYWLHATFPTVTAVIAHLPFALIPFAFSMFVLVQALVTKGWVPVFAYGWDRWAKKTGIIGAISGMGFLSVILCNVSFFIRIRGPTMMNILR